jgi:hypothetical protein
MTLTSSVAKNLPFKIVGSNIYGRYPMISAEQTFNMIISDNFLVPYAGYKKVVPLTDDGRGRGIYSSVNYNKIFAVIDNEVYAVNQNLAYQQIGVIDTFDGDVFIAENNAKQIAFCDKSAIYIYDQAQTPKFQKVTFVSEDDFLPGYITFQNGYFIAPDLRRAEWRLSDFNNGLSWPVGSSNVGTFQTKPNKPVAAIPFPGKGNLLFVFGETVVEPWFNTGQQLFPYQKNTYQNSDYGTNNAATIAAGDNFIIWLAVNEKSGPALMISDSGEPHKISTDGIDFKLSQLAHPNNAYGFLFRQDGRLLYQLTFPLDNWSLLFDIEAKSFYTPTDKHMGYHIAKRVVSFNNSYYFVSFKDGNIYELNSKYTDFDGEEIPRVRVCNTLRMPDSSRFVVNNLTFHVEQGEYSDLQAIDFSFSKDNGNSYSSYERIDLSKTGFRQRRINFWNKGIALNFTPQIRFYGKGRFLAGNGTMSYYQ